MQREIGHIRPDMTMSGAEIKAERKAWDDAIAEAVAAEREACAKVAADYYRTSTFNSRVRSLGQDCADGIAAAIRTRSNTSK